MTQYGLGIDTGGTYTDSAVVDLETNEVLCFNKALTTRHDLSEGIRNSLGGLDRTFLKEVSLTSLSSTLATNSVVENKCSSVGLITIGKDFPDSSRPAYFCSVDGRFGMNGTEEIPLDTEAVVRALETMRGKVDAVAVAGYLSVRNPAHELKVSELASEILDVPVVCAHTLTSQLGFTQRTTTAVMNAGLILVIRELMDSVDAVLREYGIDAPLMIVKGDGSLMNASTARKKPVDTILSGPASSIMGAKVLCGVDEAVILDMGGTTTDIGILHNGVPRVEPEGACLGGRRTRVRAADVSAYGIGGDSRIIVNGRSIVLSSVRAVPLCIAATIWPSVRSTIRTLDSVTDDRSAENSPEGDILQDTEFFILGNNHSEEGLGHADVSFLAMLREGPLRASDAGRRLGIPPHALSLSKMEERDLISRIGFTPTDVLHALGSYTEYDHEVSSVAAGYLSRKCGMNLGEFLDMIQDEVTCRIASCVMEKIIPDSSGELSQLDREIIDRTLHNISESYGLRFKLNLPIIGIGAPVKAWLPRVAEILNTELILPEHSSIGNALGAITGSVTETVTVLVRADSDNLTENIACRVYSDGKIRFFENQADALVFARTEAERIALESAVTAGASDPVVDVTIKENNIELCSGKEYFRSAEVCARATGKPDLF